MSGAILGYGVYIPRYRVKREDIARAWDSSARGENCAAHVNEDSITMAIEAAQNAVTHSGVNPSALDAIYLGTESAPNIEQSAVGAIAATLGARPDIDMVDLGASPRSSIAALKSCLDAVAAGRIKSGLVIGSDCRSASPGSDLELTFGAAAAALVVGRGDGIATVEEIYTYSTEFRDTWRSSKDNYVKIFEPRYSREFGYSRHVAEAAKGLLSKAGLSVNSFQHAVLQQPDDRTPRATARSLGLSPKQTETGFLFPGVGDTGSSSLLLGLAAVLDKARPGEKILGISYGSGASDALIVAAGPGIENRRSRAKAVDRYCANKEYIDYTTYLKRRGIVKEDAAPSRMGLPPMSPLVTREMRELLQLIGAKCHGCGYINYPPSERRICIRCGGTKFDQVSLARRGKIHTYCISYYLPAGFDESPLPVIVADMEDGSRYRALGTEMKPADVKIDETVELVVRRLATEDNTNLYGNVFRFPR